MESRGKAAVEKGKDFEDMVAKWARRRFDALEVGPRQHFNGKAVARPYEIDLVFITKRRKLLGFGPGHVIWIECKNRQSSIKRDDIQKFRAKAQDVKNNAINNPPGAEWDNLVFVSTSKFDNDAIRVAEDQGISCYWYDGRAFRLVTE
ncbi:MAG: restriction endonuclease [Chloroflexi bacterium]|nr:restriction endonuclease [Chloroflexota bacterium]